MNFILVESSHDIWIFIWLARGSLNVNFSWKMLSLLAAIAALQVAMSVGLSVGRSVGPQRVSKVDCWQWYALSARIRQWESFIHSTTVIWYWRMPAVYFCIHHNDIITTREWCWILLNDITIRCSDVTVTWLWRFHFQFVKNWLIKNYHLCVTVTLLRCYCDITVASQWRHYYVGNLHCRHKVIMRKVHRYIISIMDIYWRMLADNHWLSCNTR